MLLEGPKAEGDGWVNWSGLATLLATLDNAFRSRLARLGF
jgi:hypothetical protein